MITKEQWLEIAKAYETPPKRRTEKQELYTENGICIAVAYFREQCISYEEEMQIRDTAAEFNPSKRGYWWPTKGQGNSSNIFLYGVPWKRKYDFIRAKVCRAMAKKVKDL